MQTSLFKVVLQFIFISSFAFIFISCENNIATVNKITANDNTPVQVEKDVTISYSDSAHIKFTLSSPLMKRYNHKNPYIVLPKGVHMEFYNDSMHVTSTMSANYAINYVKEDKMEAKNDVVVINPKGERLNTEDLIWDKKKHQIYTKAFVKITTAHDVIYGDGLVSNEDFTHYKIMNIKGTISTDGK